MADSDDHSPELPAAGLRSELVLSFGERLRMLRARRGLTRKIVAKAANVSERYLAQLESAGANPSLVVLDQVARALQCSVAELVGDVTACLVRVATDS